MPEGRGDQIRHAKRVRSEHGVEIRRRYEEDYLRLEELAEEYGVTAGTISRAIKNNGGSIRKKGYGWDPRVQMGEKNASWKGGRYRRTDGYWYVLLSPDDPLGPGMVKANKRYVPEHRLVMARAIGRPLRRDETVHHINGIRDDNRLENLQLRNGRHGNGSCWRCGDCGSMNVEAVKIGESK